MEPTNSQTVPKDRTGSLKLQNLSKKLAAIVCPAAAAAAPPATADEAVANKKQKTDEDYPMAPDVDWPEAWIMADNESDPEFDQCLPNRCDPNLPVSAPDLRKIGIAYWKMDDVDKYDYPVKAVPYDPKDAMDPKLAALRDSRGYSYADIITVHPDHLPEFDVKIKAFFEEVSLTNLIAVQPVAYDKNSHQTHVFGLLLSLRWIRS
jgi:ARD/ARD' family